MTRSPEDLKTKSSKPCKFKPINKPFTPDQQCKSSTPSSISSSRSDSPALVEIADETDDCVVVQKAPVFVIYTDSELSHSANSETLSDDLRNRLVRNTLSNMRTACQSMPTPREPTSTELEDMAKALVRKFPCIARLFDDNKQEFKTLTKEERCDLTEEERSQLHVSHQSILVLQQLYPITTGICIMGSYLQKILVNLPCPPSLIPAYLCAKL